MPPLPYIAVGTAIAHGEDYPALGRVLLFQVTKQQAFRLEGGSETKLSARLALQRELAGAVTAVEHLRGFLLLAVGGRLEMHYKQGNALVKVTFLDGPQVVTSLRLVKDFLLLGQLDQSAAFVRYSASVDRITRQKMQSLQLLGADTESLASWAVEFLINGPKLGLVMADGGRNVTVFAYDKADPESWAGKKLLRRGAAHVGASLTDFQRLRMSVPDDPTNRQALLGASLEGGLLLVVPFWDDGAFRRLSSLHEELVYRLQHAAGLNPKAFQARYARAGPAEGAGHAVLRPLRPADNAALQGDVVWAFAGLDTRAQAVIAEAVGADPTELLADLRALSVAATVL